MGFVLQGGGEDTIKFRLTHVSFPTCLRGRAVHEIKPRNMLGFRRSPPPLSLSPAHNAIFPVLSVSYRINKWRKLPLFTGERALDKFTRMDLRNIENYMLVSIDRIYDTNRCSIRRSFIEIGMEWKFLFLFTLSCVNFPRIIDYSHWNSRVGKIVFNYYIQFQIQISFGLKHLNRPVFDNAIHRQRIRVAFVQVIEPSHPSFLPFRPVSSKL